MNESPDRPEEPREMAAIAPPQRARRGSMALFWGVALGLPAILRFATLGRQSPWLDEINNWLIASKYGFHAYPGLHSLTYRLQAVGLRISDSVWGLRLYSAALGTLAVWVAVFWAWKRLGPLAAGCAAAALGLSPFGLFYSQDANHYAPLLFSGIVAVVAVDGASTLRGWRRWGAAALGFAGTAFSLACHPLGAAALACWGATVFYWAFREARRLPPRRANATVKRICITAIFFCMAILALTRGLDALVRLQGAPQPNELPVGFNPAFLSAVLADLFGAIYHQSIADQWLGWIGLLLGAGGWIWAGARRGTGIASLGALTLIVLTCAPFFLFTFPHYFSPRYFAPAQGALALGLGLFFAQAARAVIEPAPARGGRRGGWRNSLRLAAAMIAFLWLAIFLGRFGVWQMARLRADHQPSMPALEWIRENTSDKAILLTRHRYSARALTFLWDRAQMGGRRLKPLSYIHGLGAPAIQQAEEVFFDPGVDPAQVYYLSLIEDEERRAADFSEWLDQKTQVVAFFRSGSPREFAPIRWDVRVRRVLPPDSDPRSLPRRGTRASAILLEDFARGWSGEEGGHGSLALPAGTGAAYRIFSQRPLIGLTFSYRWWGKRTGPRWVIAAAEGAGAGAWAFGAEGPAEGELYLPLKIPEGERGIYLNPARREGGIEPRGAGLEIVEIRGVAPGEVPPANAAIASILSPIGALTPPDSNGPKVFLLDASMFEPKVKLARNTYSLDATLFDASGASEKPEVPVFFLQFLESMGTGGMRLDGWLDRPGAQEKIQYLAGLDWSAGPVMAAGLIFIGGKDTRVSAELLARPRHGFRPWNPKVRVYESRLMGAARPGSGESP